MGRLWRALLGPRRPDLDEPGGIEFQLPISEWVQLFRRTGFDIVDYVELRAPADATEDRFTVSAAWAREFPSEQIWRLRKPA